MIFTVPIKIVVEDNPHNPPEAKSVAKTFVLKVPRSCALNFIREKIFRQHPIVQNLVSAIYFQSDGGSNMALFNHRMEAFWSHQKRLTDQICTLHVSVLNFQESYTPVDYEASEVD